MIVSSVAYLLKWPVHRARGPLPSCRIYCEPPDRLERHPSQIAIIIFSHEDRMNFRERDLVQLFYYCHSGKSLDEFVWLISHKHLESKVENLAHS